MELANSVAGASGGFMGIGSKVSKAEKDAISLIESSLKIAKGLLGAKEAEVMSSDN